MKLYGSFTSPYVRHCRIALLETNTECEFSEADATISAKLSPMQKVPFLQYSVEGKEKLLTDSSAILKLIREQNGATFNASVEELNDFCSAGTLLDTAINLFYMEKESITPESSVYMGRQANRLQTGLAELEKLTLSSCAPYSDAELRIACLLDWALFRNRFTIDAHPNLQKFLQGVRAYPPFSATIPKG